MKIRSELVKTFLYHSADGVCRGKDVLPMNHLRRHTLMRDIAGFIAYGRSIGMNVTVEWEIRHSNDHMDDAAQRRWEEAMCTVPGYEGL